MLQLCNLCWDKGVVPSDWRNVVIVPIYKGKGERTECKNFRGISLLSVPGKVFARVLVDRIERLTVERMWNVQCGFMKGKGCVDQIFTLRMIVEKCLDVGKKVFAVFVDLEKAYDGVNRRELWQVLGEYGVRGKLLVGMRVMYENSKAYVRACGWQSV